MHESYKEIVKLVKSKRLREPFYPNDIVRATRARNKETLRKMPATHRKGNARGNSELFIPLKERKVQDDTTIQVRAEIESSAIFNR